MFGKMLRHLWAKQAVNDWWFPAIIWYVHWLTTNYIKIFFINIQSIGNGICLLQKSKKYISVNSKF